MPGRSPSPMVSGIVRVMAGAALAPHEVRDADFELPLAIAELDDQRDVGADRARRSASRCCPAPCTSSRAGCPPPSRPLVALHAGRERLQPRIGGIVRDVTSAGTGDEAPRDRRRSRSAWSSALAGAWAPAGTRRCTRTGRASRDLRRTPAAVAASALQRLPQPSPPCPQVRCWSAHVSGAHPSGPPPAPHTLCLPPPPQVMPAGQLPHWTTPPHLESVTGPQLAPSALHDDGHPRHLHRRSSSSHRSWRRRSPVRRCRSSRRRPSRD